MVSARRVARLVAPAAVVGGGLLALTTAGVGHAAAVKAGTFTGPPVATLYGPVQVEITTSGGQVTAAKALSYPSENIGAKALNSAVVLVLNDQVVTGQTGQITGVTGATLTSTGYRQSVQAAFDQATA